MDHHSHHQHHPSSSGGAAPQGMSQSYSGGVSPQGMSQSYPGGAAAPPPSVGMQGQAGQQPPQPSLHQSGGQQAFHHHHMQQQQQQQQQLHMFWAFQMQEIEQVNDFKNHQLPLARIKKIMKADEDVRMISAEAPVLFAKACEMFILELTLRSWNHAEENKRRTLQKNDIAAAITRTDIFDFLVDIVPRDELKEEGLGLGFARGGMPPEGSFYYPSPSMPQSPHQQGMIGSPSVMMGRPAPLQVDPSVMYMQQQQTRPYGMPPHPHQPMWQHPHHPQPHPHQQQQQQQLPDGQTYGHPHQQHQQHMPDGQSYGQHQSTDEHSYGSPPGSAN